MFNNHLKIAWRNLLKNPFYSFVTLLGLSIGMSFTLLIGSYIWSEYNVNRGLKNAGNQYIIQSKWQDPNQGIELTTFGPLAKTLHLEYPHLVKNHYRWDGISSNVTKGDKAFREGLQICDSTMLEMYGFTLLSGDPKTAFDEPYSLIITDEKAMKYFNRTDVLGESLTIENFSGSKHDFKITGVLKKPGRNSVTWINPDNDNQFYISSSNITYFGRNMDNWQNQYIPSYVELQPNIKPGQVTAAIDQLIKLHVAPSIAKNVTTYLKPLNEFYLSAFNGLIRKLIYALAGIAFFILIMAVINYINLSTSRSATRIREIGIRKVMGGLQYQLISQFLMESILLTLIATILSVGIAEMALPLFVSIMGKAIPSFFSLPVAFVWLLSLLVLLIGSLAGLYPALILSGMETVDSLKGKLRDVADKVVLRKSLVGFQFGTALVVCVAAIIISKQVDYFFSKDLGFDKEFIVSAPLPRDWTPSGVQKMKSIRDQFATLPEVKNITMAYEIMDGNSSGSISLYRADRDSSFAVAGTTINTDEHFASTYSIPIVAGEFFSNSSASKDSSKIVINESQVKAMGWSTAEQAINKQIKIVGNPFVFTVSGVTRDFNFGALNTPIQPIAFTQVELNPIYRFFSFKLAPGDVGKSLEVLQKKWNALMPGTPFEYDFMDDKLANLYLTELQLKKASYTATVLTFIIVFLGVLGLIGLSLQKRIKEIGIRKVLGSTVRGIITLFIKEFLIIIFIAGLVASPIAYLLMNHWLKAYAYRIDLTLMPFLIAIGTLVLLTALLISIQTFRAANANPIKSLRTE